jgi:hypothetical protein
MKNVLCEFTEYNGNFQQISLHILNKIQKHENEVSYEYDKYKFFLLNNILPANHKNLSVITLVEKGEIENYFLEDEIYSYLNNLKDRLLAMYTYEKLDLTLPYSLTEFIPEIKEEMKNFESRINKLKRKNTIAAVSTRRFSTESFSGSRISMIISKSSKDLNTKREAVLKKEKLFNRSKKCCIWTIVGLVVLALVITAIIIIFTQK